MRAPISTTDGQIPLDGVFPIRPCMLRPRSAGCCNQMEGSMHWEQAAIAVIRRCYVMLCIGSAHWHKRRTKQSVDVMICVSETMLREHVSICESHIES
jgi:hypothetical protein